MNIAHVTTYCLAGGTGGTERYVADLAAGLAALGHRSTIWWLHNGPAPAPAGDDPPIHTLPRGEMRVDDPPADLLPRLRALLDGPARPDLLHFHTFGRTEAALAAAAGLPFVFTYHSPAWTCRRETLLRWGGPVCDGEVRALRCAACKLQERLNSAPWLGYAGALASQLAGPLIPDGPRRRRFAFTADTARLRADLRAFLAACRCTIACAEWSRPVLRANGAPRDRLVHLPQGVPDGFPAARAHPPAGALFTVGFVGRLNEVKGIHLLIEAFRRTDYPQARLRVCGWSDAPQLRSYGDHLRALAGDDPRITFVGERRPADMPDEYARLSLLAIPSVWMETGPLTLLEALQFGVPVYGSARIGQHALLERYGRVIEPNTTGEWARALEEAFDLHMRGRWRPVTLAEPLPTMRDVAARMAEHYARAVRP